MQSRRKWLKSVLLVLFTAGVTLSLALNGIAALFEQPAFTTLTEPYDTLTVNTEADAGEAAGVQKITLSFVGDCMLASMLGQPVFNSFNLFAQTTPKEYFFEGVQSVFAADDFTIANCENVFTDRTLPAVGKNYTPAYWYKSPSSYAEIFTAGSVEVVSIDNNHIYDYGIYGREDTITALEYAGVMWGDTDNIVYLEKHGVKIALLCTSVSSGGWTPVWDELEEAVQNSDYQIVYFHGGVERSYELDPVIQKVCYRFVENGADLVLGHHPHVLQPIDVYYGVKIVYSLGNFLFGGGIGEDETMIYRLELDVLDGEIISTHDYPIPALCYTKEGKWQPAILTDPERYNKIIEFLYMVREVPY